MLAKSTSATKISTLHNVWQTVAQLNSPPASDYLTKAAMVDDDQVERWAHEDGHGRQLVGIRSSDTTERIEIFGLRRREVKSGDSGT
jgi:hypothetical protein